MTPRTIGRIGISVGRAETPRGYIFYLPPQVCREGKILAAKRSREASRTPLVGAVAFPRQGVLPPALTQPRRAPVHTELSGAAAICCRCVPQPGPPCSRRQGDTAAACACLSHGDPAPERTTAPANPAGDVVIYRRLAPSSLELW